MINYIIKLKPYFVKLTKVQNYLTELKVSVRRGAQTQLYLILYVLDRNVKACEEMKWL